MGDVLDFGEEQVEPFRVTPGFIAFVALLLMPIVIATAVYLGAWAVSAEVRAAEADAGAQGPQAGFNTVSENEVASWKKSLVGLCPLH